MKTNYIFIAIIFLIKFSSALNANNSKSIATDTIYANITPAQAYDTIIAHADDPWFVILDVRTPGEYTVKHIAEGVDIDFYLADFTTILATLNRNKTYVLHCASGGRSGQVYTMMQNLHFTKVYNMSGGLNAWTAASLPVTTDEAPANGILCDTIVSFENVSVNQTDSLQLMITNAANSTLHFDSISDLSGTEFSTNFDTSISILGARDYEFTIYYTPNDTSADSTIFFISSNAGTMYFYLFGTALSPTGIKNIVTNPFAIYNDRQNYTIQFNLDTDIEGSLISLTDIQGKIVYRLVPMNSHVSIDYSSYKSGVYFLNIINGTSSASYKIPLLK